MEQETTNLRAQVKELAERNEEKVIESENKSKDVSRLTQKIIDQDEEIQSLRGQLTDRGYDIQLQKVKMKDFESTIIEKSLTITKLETEFEKIKQYKLDNELLKKQLR